MKEKKESIKIFIKYLLFLNTVIISFITYAFTDYNINKEIFKNMNWTALIFSLITGGLVIWFYWSTKKYIYFHVNHFITKDTTVLDLEKKYNDLKYSSDDLLQSIIKLENNLITDNNLLKKELEKAQIANIYNNETIKEIKKYIKDKFGDEIILRRGLIRNKTLHEKLRTFDFDTLNLANNEIK